MLSPKKRSLYAGWSAAGDLFAIGLGFLLAYWLRFSETIVPAQKGIPPMGEYAKALFIAAPVYLWVFRSYGLYQPGRHVRRVEEIFLVLKGISVGSLVLMALTFFYRGFSFSRVFLIFLWVSAALCVSMVRYLIIQLRYRRRRQSKDLHRILIVGANRNARKLIEWARMNPHFGHHVMGVLAKEKNLLGKHFEGVPVVGTLEEYDKVVAETRPDEIIITDPDLPKEQITNMLLRCESGLVSFKVAADLYGLVTSNLDVEHIASVPLLGLRSLPLDDPWNRWVKRGFDLVLSGLSFVLVLPVMIVIVLAIKWADGGPIFYTQERIGQDGRSFKLHKFRTMGPEAEAKTGPVWAQKGDERRTPVGVFLRRFNLDELPQLWNVFWGEMSLVGPRPERPHFVNQFRDEIPRYMARHKIKSGITGWAQVNGLRGNTSIQERIRYDLYYAENWSLLFDLEILFMTFFAFKNAY